MSKRKAEWEEVERTLIRDQLTVYQHENKWTVDYIAPHYRVVERRKVGKVEEFRQRNVQGEALYLNEYGLTKGEKTVPGVQVAFQVAATVLPVLVQAAHVHSEHKRKEEAEFQRQRKEAG